MESRRHPARGCWRLSIFRCISPQGPGHSLQFFPPGRIGTESHYPPRRRTLLFGVLFLFADAGFEPAKCSRVCFTKDFYPQKGALTHHRKTSSVVRSLQLTSYNLQLVYSSSWTIAVFTCVALTGIFCIKTTQHIITLITATLNSWIGTVTWTIFSLIARYQNNSRNIYNHIHTSFLIERTNTLYNAIVYM